MGYGSRGIGSHRQGARYRHGAGIYRGGFRYRHRYGHRRRWGLRFGGRRRYYGGHHVWHTRAYYVGAETATAPPPQPNYIVIYETQSQFQKIKVVEFTDQPVAQVGTVVQAVQMPNGQLAMATKESSDAPLVTSNAINANNNNNNEPPAYNPAVGITSEGDEEKINTNVQQPQLMNVVVVGGNCVLVCVFVCCVHEFVCSCLVFVLVWEWSRKRFYFPIFLVL